MHRHRFGRIGFMEERKDQKCHVCGKPRAEIQKERRMGIEPFDTENRPSIFDKCARCGHTFQFHNISCSIDGCICKDFMVRVHR